MFDGIRRAIAHLYRESGVVMDETLKMNLSQRKNDATKQTLELKGKEGKDHMTIEVFELIAMILLQSGAHFFTYIPCVGLELEFDQDSRKHDRFSLAMIALFLTLQRVKAPKKTNTFMLIKKIYICPMVLLQDFFSCLYNHLYQWEPSKSPDSNQYLISMLVVQ